MQVCEPVLKYSKIKYQQLADVTTYLQQDHFVFSTDAKSGYHHVPMQYMILVVVVVAKFLLTFLPEDEEGEMRLLSIV